MEQSENSHSFGCPFCNLDPSREIIAESELAFAIYDKYPVNKGHTLIIPKRHCSSYFELTPEEQASCWQMVNELKTVMTEKYNTDGFNIGININEEAGQTIPHVHIHLIPRYKGDIDQPEGGVRGVIPEKRLYRSNMKIPVGLKQISTILNEFNAGDIQHIKKEIQQKESWLISVAENKNLFDKTHTEMVLDFIRENKVPKRPETLNKLMIQFISRAFSYNRIRKQMRKINREKFHLNNYPVRSDYKKILAYLLDDKRFLREDYWHPKKFQELITEIEIRGRYKDLQILSDYWLEHIMGILRTAPVKLLEFTHQNIDTFYIKVEEICNQQNNNIFEKAKNLWNFATELSQGIRNVGTNLMCDFLKESGFTDYAKMDVHLIRYMSHLLSKQNHNRLTDYESFVVTQWLADQIKITPFKMDKILYVYSLYNH